MTMVGGSTLGSEGESGPASVRRVLRLLEAFRPDESYVPLGVLAKRACIPLSTTHRLLSALVDREFVSTDGNGNYSLGIRAWEVGSRSIQQRGITATLEPYLERAAKLSGETVHVSVLAGGWVVYVARLGAARSVAVQTFLGQRAPAAATATGKAILSRQPPDVTEAIVRAGLRKYTPKTCTNATRFKAGLEESRQRGYAINVEEWQDDLAGVAAPILDRFEISVAAVGIAAPAHRVDDGRLHAWGHEIRAIAREIVMPSMRTYGASGLVGGGSP